MNSREHIEYQLTKIEKEMGVTILYACEGGSRAWGTNSLDSDHDVRFIYIRPPQDYLTLDYYRVQGKGVIDDKQREEWRWLHTEMYDFVGWDIYKACNMAYKSNPNIWEWLSSPITYRHTDEATFLKAIAKSAFNPMASVHHYEHLLSSNYRKYILNNPKDDMKRYLNVIRALLARDFIIKEQRPVLVNMRELMDHLSDNYDEEFSDELLGLLEWKYSGRELDKFNAQDKIPCIASILKEKYEEIDADPSRSHKIHIPPTEAQDEMKRNLNTLIMDLHDLP